MFFDMKKEVKQEQLTASPIKTPDTLLRGPYQIMELYLYNEIDEQYISHENQEISWVVW